MSYQAEAGVETRVCADLAGEAAALFTAEARGKSRFFVALSGGSTPGAMFDRLAAAPAGAVDWASVHLFWGDERGVGPEHKDSNYGQAKARLLDKVPVPPANVHRFRGELPPAEAAAQMAEELRAAFALAPGAVPRFDLVLLGMGDDGHTASLFPGTAALAETQALAAANPVPQLSTTRLTFTYPVLNAAALVAVLVGGAGKAEIAREVLKTPAIPAKYPMQGVRPAHGRLVWLMDRDAARLSAV